MGINSYLATNELIRLVNMFNPIIMMGAKIFVPEGSLDMYNRFIKIKGETMSIHANEEIVIGGIITKVPKIMLFKISWLFYCYYYPLNRFTRRDYGYTIFLQVLSPRFKILIFIIEIYFSSGGKH